MTRKMYLFLLKVFRRWLHNDRCNWRTEIQRSFTHFLGFSHSSFSNCSTFSCLVSLPAHSTYHFCTHSFPSGPKLFCLFMSSSNTSHSLSSSTSTIVLLHRRKDLFPLKSKIHFTIQNSWFLTWNTCIPIAIRIAFTLHSAPALSCLSDHKFFRTGHMLVKYSS